MGLGEGSRRLVRVTPGNLRFPSDCIGPPRRRANGNEPCIELELDGLGEVVSTDIGASAADGKPRGFFRGRQWLRRFFQRHQVAPADLLNLQTLGLADIACWLREATIVRASIAYLTCRTTSRTVA